MLEPDVNTPAPPARRAASIAAKLAVVAGFFAAWSILYDLANAHGSAPGRAVTFARPFDLLPGLLQPWTAVVYLVGGVALPLLPFCFHWRWPGIRFVLTCYTIAAGVTFAAYWLWPVRMDRPVFDAPGLGSRLMRWVQAVDQPANCCPSSHALFAVLGALLVAHGVASRPVQVATWSLAVAVCATTITTGQHYFIDVAVGVGVAVAAYAVARNMRLNPREASPRGGLARRER